MLQFMGGNFAMCMQREHSVTMGWAECLKTDTYYKPSPSLFLPGVLSGLSFVQRLKSDTGPPGTMVGAECFRRETLCCVALSDF